MNQNKCLFTGRLTADPEVRYSGEGKAVVNFTLAVNGYKDSVEFVRHVAFGKTAEIIGQYCDKGKLIRTEGRMQTRKWKDKEGITRYTTEIVCFEMEMLGGKGEGQSRPQEKPMGGQDGPFPKPDPDEDQDIPF